MTVKKKACLRLSVVFTALFFIADCTTTKAETEDLRNIIRIGCNQSTNHPTHTGMIAFEEYIEDELTGNMMFRFLLMNYWVVRQIWFN